MNGMHTHELRGVGLQRGTVSDVEEAENFKEDRALKFVVTFCDPRHDKNVHRDTEYVQNDDD